MSYNHFFNVSDPHTCCYDVKLSEELISKCKEKPQHLKNFSIIFITFKWYSWWVCYILISGCGMSLI